MLLITDSFEVGSLGFGDPDFTLQVEPVSWSYARDLAHDDCTTCLAMLGKSARKALTRELELEGKRLWWDYSTPRKGNRYLVGYRTRKQFLGSKGTRWFLVTVS